MNKRPNIVFYCTDQQRADLLGCIGHPQIRTPNLDKLAEQGALLGNLYVQGTVCMPSRASIMTGRYPCVHGVVDNGFDLPENEVTIADLLRESGYHTMAVGRTHIVCTQKSSDGKTVPDDSHSKDNFYGFSQCAHAQVYCAGTDPGNDYLKWVEKEHPEVFDEIAFANNQDRRRDDILIGSETDIDEKLSLTSWVTSKSLEFIEEHCQKSSEQPFFLWAGTWDPHSPFRVPPPWDRMYAPEDMPLPVRSEKELDALPPPLRRLAVTEWKMNPEISLDQVLRNTISVYWGTISHIDDQFGRLVKGLEKMGILENTIIVFTSDHGEMLGDHWMRSKGLYFYDGALRVPGIIRAPGFVKEGVKYHSLLETIDLLPTLLDMAGTDVPQNIQGKSFQKLLEQGKFDVVHREEVYSEYHSHAALGKPDRRDERVFSIFNGRYRIVYFQGREYGQLFDLENDPDAMNNLWNRPEHAELKQQMTEKLMNRIMANISRPDTRKAPW